LTEDESKQNIFDWLDKCVLQFCQEDVFVSNCNGVKQPGFYQGILDDQLTKIISRISIEFVDWGKECAANNLSCGTMYKVVGAGKGHMVIEPYKVGPFLT